MKWNAALMVVASVACSLSAGCKDPPVAVDAGISEVPVPGSDGGIVGSGESISATIGSEGGTLTLGGSTIDIPAGALDEMTAITVTETTTPTPPGYRAFSPLFRFEPEGLVFAAPVTVRLPSSASNADAPLATLFWSRPEGDGGGWQRIGGIPSGGVVTGSVEHFSFGFLADGVDYTETPDRSCVQTRVLDWRPLRSSGSGLGLFFTMDDCWGRPITDLTNDELVVFEDGVALSSEASAQLYEQRGLHVFVTLAIDVSSSTQPILPEVISAARRFVETLNDPARGLRDRVQVSILAFAGDDVGPNDPNDWEAPQKTDLWQRHTLDLDLVLTRLDDLAAHTPSDPSSTNLHGALVYSLERNTAAQEAFRERNRGGAFSAGYVVLFTDGADTAGRVDFQTARAELEGSSDDVVAVGLHGDDYDPTALRALVGEAQVIDSEDEVVLDRDFGYLAARIAGQVRRSYLLGYCSPKRSGNHTVHIGVEGAETRVSGVVPDFFAGNFSGGCAVEMFDPAVVCAEAECGGFGCGACDDRVDQCDVSLGSAQPGLCVSQCLLLDECGGDVITNPLGYEQLCTETSERTSCNGHCYDTTRDPSNCGDCGFACATGAACMASECACPDELPDLCNGACVDLSSDAANCGTCGKVCETGAACGLGECVCPGEQPEVCAGECRDLATDPYNCGACGNVCPGVGCESGLCQCPGYMPEVCSGACRDLRDDTANCGACGNACPPGIACEGGVCACEGRLPEVCSGECRDLATDEQHCGSCGYACGLNAICSEGSCLQVAEMALGTFHTCARMSGGTAHCWGNNGFGQLGDGSTSYSLFRVREPVPGLTNVAEVALGAYHTCVRLTDGTVRCWGANDYGQLGDGTTVDRYTPTPVPALTGVAEIALGGRNTCARLTDGTVRCWGSNTVGQLGDGTFTDRHVPTLVPGLTGVTRIALAPGFNGAYGRTCVLLADKTVQCWGSVAGSLLGDSSGTSSSSTPAAVPNLTNVVEIVLGYSHTCARVDAPQTGWPDSEVLCWGESLTGIDGLTNVASLAAGYDGTCARRNDGTVHCWGGNYYHLMGGDGLADVAGLAAGPRHACALITDGNMLCWGRNDAYELGILFPSGNGTSISVPTAVEW